MKIIIPVAGLGKRLRPLTDITPKVLLPVAGKPVLGHILDSIVELQPSEVRLVIGHLGDQVKEFVRSEYRFPSQFIVQEQLLGLGYALHLAVESISDEPVLIILGDTITDCNLPEMIAAGDNVLGLKPVEDPRRFGVADVVDGRVTGLTEKPEHPRSNKALVGLYFISDIERLKEQLEHIVDANYQISGEIQLTSALEAMITEGTTFVPWEIDQWYDCGKSETLLATNRRLLAKGSSPASRDGVDIIPPAFVAPDAQIKNSTIGPDVSIQSGAVITDSVIKDSIICRQARITDCKLTGSIIGRRVDVTGENGSRLLAK